MRKSFLAVLAFVMLASAGIVFAQDDGTQAKVTLRTASTPGPCPEEDPDCNKNKTSNRPAPRRRSSSSPSANANATAPSNVQVTVNADGLIKVIEKEGAEVVKAIDRNGDKIVAELEETSDEIVDGITEASDINHDDMVKLMKINAAGFNNQMTSAQANQIITLLTEAYKLSAEQTEYLREINEKTPGKGRQLLRDILMGATAVGSVWTGINTRNIANNTGDTNNILTAIFERVFEGGDGRNRHPRHRTDRPCHACNNRNPFPPHPRPNPRPDPPNRPCRVRNGQPDGRLGCVPGNRQRGDNTIDPLVDKRRPGYDPWRDTGNFPIDNQRSSSFRNTYASNRSSDRVARRDAQRSSFQRSNTFSSNNSGRRSRPGN